VTLVESLEVDCDVDRCSSRFVARCVALLDVTAAAMLVTDHRGSLRIAAWSSEQARHFVAAELRRGQGPSVECHLTGVRGVYPTNSALADRWPPLADTASAADITAVYALPLRYRNDAFGVLTLLDRQPARLGDDILQLVGLLANGAAIGLATRHDIDYHQRAAAQLQSALTSRVAIEQAKGMLAERLGIPVDAAFDLLRGHARGNSRNLHEVAAEIINRRLDIGAHGSDRTAPHPRTPPPSL
jgi:GAF domain-containing protein